MAGYTTQYRIGRTGPWQNYTGQVDVDNGETIYARYKDDTGVSQTVSQIVEDTNGPDVTLVDLAVNGGEITIQVTAVDNEMGMPEPPTYNFYIKPTTETYFESMDIAQLVSLHSQVYKETQLMILEFQQQT